MENESLIEIRNRLAMLPVLQERLDKLRLRIGEAEEEVQSLLRKYEAEALDVEQLQKDSLSATILRLIGKYEGKVDKEKQEMLTAKMEYDKAADRVKALHLERDELYDRISALKQDKKVYEDEFKKREEAIKSNVAGEASIKLRQLEAEQDALSRQLVETDEALRAANRVLSTASNAMQHLDSAESWATYDVWFKGGILSHMAKYEHIDNAQSDFNRLHSQMTDLQKELQDVNILDTPALSGVDSTTRAIDFWFDNIFTDLNVRDRIRGDKEELGRLSDRMHGIMRKLESNKKEINKKLADIELRKNDLIISV